MVIIGKPNFKITIVYIMIIKMNKTLISHEQTVGNVWHIYPIVTFIIVLNHTDDIYKRFKKNLHDG